MPRTPQEQDALRKRCSDSVHVSFYKGIGALAGAMLAGDAALIAEARVWRRRHGGTAAADEGVVPWFANLTAAAQGAGA